MADPAIVTEILYGTKDPTIMLDPSPVPAMTTLLHRICDNNPAKFEEAMRIVELFIVAALDRSMAT